MADQTNYDVIGQPSTDVYTPNVVFLPNGKPHYSSPVDERAQRKKTRSQTLARNDVDSFLNEYGIVVTPKQYSDLVVYRASEVANYREGQDQKHGGIRPPAWTPESEWVQQVLGAPGTYPTADNPDGAPNKAGTDIPPELVPVVQEAIKNGALGEDIQKIIDLYNDVPPPTVYRPDTEAPPAPTAPPAPDIGDDPVTQDPDNQKTVTETALEILTGILNDIETSPSGEIPTTGDTGTFDPTVGDTTTRPTGQTDRSGNPYDPQAEAEYAERNPGYPNPFSLPEGQEGTGELGNDPTGTGTGIPNIFGLPPELWDMVQGQIGGTLDDSNSRRGINRALRETQPRPMGLDTPVGNIRWNDGVGSMQNIDPNFQAMATDPYRVANNQLNDPLQNQMSRQSMGMSLDAMPEAFQTALNTGAISPDNPEFMALVNQAVGPEREALFNSGQYQNQQGQKFLGNTDFQKIAGRRLDLLRRQTDPYNQQQSNQLSQDLFNSGNLNSKAGSMDRGALALTHQTRDIQNQLNAQDMARNLRNDNITAGTNLLGQGDSAFANAGQLGLQGTELGIKGTQAENARKRNRLLDVQNQFGFGQQVKGTQIDNAANAAGIGNDTNQLILDMFGTAANPYGYGSNPYGGSAASQVYAQGGVPGNDSGTQEQQQVDVATKTAEMIFGVDLDGDGKIGF